MKVLLVYFVPSPFGLSRKIKMYLVILHIMIMFSRSVATNESILNFPAVFAFGDSILDTGNNNRMITPSKCNFPPYGKDFIGHKATGRFSNGKVPSDFIVSKFGIKDTLPAYLSPELTDEDLLTGVCFASGGAGFDPITSILGGAISMTGQLELFKEYKKKIEAITEPERAATILRDSLYFFCTGNNDVANTYFGPTTRRAQYDIDAYAHYLATSASKFVQDLYSLGARKIVVTGLPPLGCLPSQRTLGGGLQRNCVDKLNEASQKFNDALIMEVQTLQKKLSLNTIVYADIFQKLLNFIQHPSQYGFEEATRGCCGTGTFEVTKFCNKITPLCIDDTKYVFWDSFHPTERAYGIIIDQIVEEELRVFK